MTPFSCPRTSELQQAVKAGHASSAWDPSLREHVAGCRICGDLVLVSESLRSARERSVVSAPDFSPGLLWWRAQLRRRNQALQQISRPTSIIGKIALLATVVIAVVALVWQRQQSAEWLRWLFSLQDSTATHHATLATQVSFWNLLVGAISLGAIAFLGAFAVYLASEKN